MDNWWPRNCSIPSRNKEEESIWMNVTDIQTNKQAGGRLDSAPSANVVAMATRVSRTRFALNRPSQKIPYKAETSSAYVPYKSSYRRFSRKFRCHGNRGRPDNILYGSIESAIPENPLVGANIYRLSAIQAKLYSIFGQILGSQFWGLGGLNQKSKNNVL